MNFNDAFIARTRDGSGIARKYIQGLLLNRDRGNCSRFAKKVRKSSNQSLQHFITHSPWNERIVIDKIQKKVSKMIGDSDEGSLHIDETGFPKQGTHSVGVQRQYCGRLGKVENCQVGVVLGYSHKNQRILIDGQLYLPEEWSKSKELRNECEVPKEVQFRTKAQIGLDMILNARKNGVPFGWIGMDCFYGEQPWLREELDAEGLIFVADIPRDTRVWLSRPKTGIPERSGKRDVNLFAREFSMTSLRQLRFKRLKSRLILHNGDKSRSGIQRGKNSRSILFAFESIRLKTDYLERNCGSSSEKR